MRALAKLAPPTSRLLRAPLSFVQPSQQPSLANIIRPSLSSRLPPWKTQARRSRGFAAAAVRFSTRAVVRSQRISKESDAILDDQIPESVLAAKNDKLTCSYFDKDGSLISKHREITKADIAAQFELRHRDLRDIDLRSESVTRILIRPATILLQFFDLCMIIQADEALLIESQRHHTDQSGLPYHDFERRMSGAKEVADIPELPYELRAVEAALVAVLSVLREALIEARDEAEHSAQNLKVETGLAAVSLDLLFERSRRLSKIEQKARLVRDTIAEVLDNDEDLASMYLSDRVAGKPHATSDHQEAEYMLEAYHKAADALVESASSAINVIRKKENTFRSSLAVQRNQIMFLEARIAIHTLGLAAGTLVAGLFGMNLVNYFEESAYGFVVVTGICVVLSSLFSVYGMRSIRRIQTLKEVQSHRVERLLRPRKST